MGNWIIAIVCFVSVANGYRAYHNYQVFSVTPSTNKQVLQLRALEVRQASCHKLDFWASATTIGKSVDIMVSPTAKEYINIALDNIKAPYNVKIHDVGEIIESQRTSRDSVTTLDTDFFQTYKTYEQIEVWKERLINKYDFIEEINIGFTYENRPMKAIKISGGPENSRKIAAWFQGGIHAREWISPATVIYFTNQLLLDYDANLQDAVDIINNYDIYVLFIMNIDGYVYTWEEDRLWRKSRMNNEDSTCVGVDQNRNYLYEWGGEGSSSNPCSENYRGPYAGSEPEVRAVINALRELDNLRLFIDFHSYSQFIMYPWGYSEDAPPIDDEEKLNTLADIMASSIESVYGTKYTIGSISQTLYAASGNTVDFAYSDGVEYGFIIELPDTGNYGFLLPEEDIIPTGIETYTGLVAVLTYPLST